jgi:2,3-bisphosphoglycerate-dependent phosphoglycerate mutase
VRKQVALGWPASIWVVRHGESAGNIARDQAESAAAQMIDIDQRDVDVPLSDLGGRQARALGDWIAGMDKKELPTLVVASSYVRAIQTAEITMEAAGLDVPLRIDERLREREFGILDRLTRLGIRERFPQESELRTRLGKFYHRPAGGESWTDVIARVRATLTDLRLDVAGERVLIVAHQVVVLSFRYILEELTEADILAVDREAEVANCSLTRFEVDQSSDSEQPRLVSWNETAPVEEGGEAVTAEPEHAEPDQGSDQKDEQLARMSNDPSN